MFDVLREPDAVADRERDVLSVEHAELLRPVKWQLVLDAMLCVTQGFPRVLESWACIVRDGRQLW